MIRSFRDGDTERLFRREPIKRLPKSLLRVAFRKLMLFDAANNLDDLESLRGTDWRN